MNKFLQKLLGFTAVAGLALAAIVTSASAADTCPEGDGWVKIDGLSGLIYTFDVPEGYEVVENCMKVGSHDPVFGSGDTVTNTSLFNSPGGVTCTAPGVPHNGCALQEISHASFKLQEAGEEPTATPTLVPGEPTPTPGPENTPTPEPGVTPTPGRPGEFKKVDPYALCYSGQDNWFAKAEPGVEITVYQNGQEVASGSGDWSTVLPVGQYTWEVTDDGGFSLQGPQHGPFEVIWCPSDTATGADPNGFPIVGIIAIPVGIALLVFAGIRKAGIKLL